METLLHKKSDITVHTLRMVVQKSTSSKRAIVIDYCCEQLEVHFREQISSKIVEITQETTQDLCTKKSNENPAALASFVSGLSMFSSFPPAVKLILVMKKQWEICP